MSHTEPDRFESVADANQFHEGARADFHRVRRWVFGLGVAVAAGSAWVGVGADLWPSPTVVQAAEVRGVSPLASLAEADGKAVVGQPAPDFTLTDTAGKSHTLSAFKGQVVVLHWQSLQCPWDKAYQPLLTELAKRYEAQDVQFLAINSNHTEHAEGKLATYHAEHGMAYPILVDKNNPVADQYGAQVTPHMYVVNPEGKLVYAGAIEDIPRSPRQAGDGNDPYLVPVIDAVLAGETPPHSETRPKGCGIKRVRR